MFGVFSLTRKERQEPAQLAKEKLVCWKIDFFSTFQLYKTDPKPSQDMKSEQLGL